MLSWENPSQHNEGQIYLILEDVTKRGPYAIKLNRLGRFGVPQFTTLGQE